MQNQCSWTNSRNDIHITVERNSCIGIFRIFSTEIIHRVTAIARSTDATQKWQKIILDYDDFVITDMIMDIDKKCIHISVSNPDIAYDIILRDHVFELLVSNKHMHITADFSDTAYFTSNRNTILEFAARYHYFAFRVPDDYQITPYIHTGLIDSEYADALNIADNTGVIRSIVDKYSVEPEVRILNGHFYLTFREISTGNLLTPAHGNIFIGSGRNLQCICDSDFQIQIDIPEYLYKYYEDVLLIKQFEYCGFTAESFEQDKTHSLADIAVINRLWTWYNHVYQPIDKRQVVTVMMAFRSADKPVKIAQLPAELVYWICSFI